MGQVQSRFIERASWLLQLPLETPTIPFDDVQTGCTLWLKLDYLLPSGCTKDRMATNIGAHAIESGEVSPTTVVVEASSGSTSIALSPSPRDGVNSGSADSGDMDRLVKTVTDAVMSAIGSA